MPTRTGADRYKDVKGTVMIGAFDFLYDAHNWIVRGNFDYGHLTNSDKISQFNRDMPNASPSPKQYVGSDAIATGWKPVTTSSRRYASSRRGTPLLRLRPL